jgi:predicted enzyme related to lactoylglutathione lyase
MPVPVHFEIAADDVKRAAKFYSRIFDWHIEKAEGEDYWLISTANEDEEEYITGGLMERIDPLDSTIMTFEVESLDVFARKITEAGGKIMTPKISIPGLGDVQYCRDTEGNSFGIIEYEKDAAGEPEAPSAEDGSTPEA